LTTDTESQPKHRRDVLRLAPPIRTSAPDQTVRTDTADELVVMTMSPAAAKTLSVLLNQAANSYQGKAVGLAGFDPALWSHVSIDLVRARTVLGEKPAPVYAAFGIPS
jgi:hypothetical protein